MGDGGYIFDEELSPHYKEWEKYGYFRLLGGDDEAFEMTVKDYGISDEELIRIIKKYRERDEASGIQYRNERATNRLKKQNHISTMWNGLCPESLLEGKDIRMRLNTNGFYESEATGLQIAVLRGVHAIILKFRGEGKFRSTPSYADEVENGEILSPQNTERPPFNNPATVFKNSDEIINYLKTIPPMKNFDLPTKPNNKVQRKISSIKLNDILRLDDLTNIKVRFNLMVDGNWNPIDVFKENHLEKLLRAQYWNYNKVKSFKEGQLTVGLIKIKKNEDYWLLFHIGRITKDLNVQDAIGYEYETLAEFEKYFGRLIVKFKNKSQNMIRNAVSVMNDCEIAQILPDVFDNDTFPGYDKVNVSWQELSRVLEKSDWKTALGNQKGVYLITDTSNGKMYVGSAYGEDMLLNRWRSYVRTRHGNNNELKKLDKRHIEAYFRYSILEIFKSTTDAHDILERESWWKEVLLTRVFGYNDN